MSRLAQRLLAARPPEPEGLCLERAAVRVLARVAVLQGERAPTRRVLGRRVAAALAAACVTLGLVGSYDAPRTTRAPVPAESPSAAAVLDHALAGDRAARRRLREEGQVGRERLWTALATGDVRALALLGEAGTRWLPGDAARAVGLAEHSDVRASMLAALGDTCAPGLCAALGDLLVRLPEAEGACVAALKRAAARGRRSEALDALLAGASAGRSAAAAAAVALGPPSIVERLLVLTPPGTLTTPGCSLALAEARATQRAQVVARAHAGSDTALAWASAARLDDALPLLAERALRDDDERARSALDALVGYGTPDAWLAVARAADAPQAARARELLGRIDVEAADALALRARREVRDRPAAFLALSSAGGPGLAALERLGRVPALRPDVLAALADAPSMGAAQTLERLAVGQDSPLPVLAALERRLLAGHGEAGLALLEFARKGPTRRAALQALQAAGPRGEVFLSLAGDDRPTPRASPRRTLPALGGGRGGARSY